MSAHDSKMKGVIRFSISEGLRYANYFPNKVHFFVLVAFCYAVHSGQVQAQAPNEIFTSDINKNFYDNCKYAIYSDLSEEEFQKTACYAHIAGSLQMFVAFGLHVMATYQASIPSINQDLSKHNKDIFCDVQGLSIRELAEKYVDITQFINKYELETKNYKYAPFASLITNKDLCGQFFNREDQ